MSEAQQVEYLSMNGRMQSARVTASTNKRRERTCPPDTNDEWLHILETKYLRRNKYLGN